MEVLRHDHCYIECETNASRESYSIKNNAMRREPYDLEPISNVHYDVQSILIDMKQTLTRHTEAMHALNSGPYMNAWCNGVQGSDDAAVSNESVSRYIC